MWPFRLILTMVLLHDLPPRAAVKPCMEDAWPMTCTYMYVGASFLAPKSQLSCCEDFMPQ